MSSNTDQFNHESLQDAESITAYLKALGQGFAQGALRFSTDDRKLSLTPQGLITMQVEAKRKGNDIKLSLKFRWSEGPKSQPESNHSLKIEPVNE
jgi:amphi-Trp domain-containing protein